MKKTFLFGAVGLLMALCVRAEDPAEQEMRLRVTLPSGHTYTLALEPGLSICLEPGGRLDTGEYREHQNTYVVNAQQDTLYSVADAAMLTYVGSFPAPPTGVEQVGDEMPDLRLQEDGISVSGCQGRTVVSVYSIDGKQCFRTVTQNGTCFVPRSGLPKGVLIIKVNNKAIKLNNR